MQAPEPEHCVLLEDLAAVRSFWVAPWALEPHVAIGQAPPVAHDTPWQALCAQHRLVPWAQLQAYDMRRQLRRAQLEDTMYLYVALWLGHLHFTPTMVFGEKRLRWPRWCRRPSHITLAYLPHRQAISLHELRARMEEAITDWLGGRANPLRRPALTSLNWSRQVYLDEYGGDEEGFLWQRVPIRQFDPEELVLLARHGRVRLCRRDTSDAPEEDGQTIEEQLLSLAEKDYRKVESLRRLELETTSWFEGTRMDDAMVHASFLPGLPGHFRRDSEILGLCRYLRRVVESSCSLPPLRKRTARMKVANDFELHSYWHVDDSPLGKVVPTWDCGWGYRAALEYAEVRCAPPALEWQPPADAPRSMHSFASLAAATMK